MAQIVARDDQVRILEAALRSRSAEFVAVYGRRRIGKTHLVREFFSDKGLYFQLTGQYDASKETQLRNFAREYADVFCKGKMEPPPSSWDEAFDRLRREVKSLSGEGKIILFFDELPWLASKRSGFLSALEFCWNRYFSQDPKIIVIVCGSAASWMMDKVVAHKGGLHGRLTRMVHLLPFNLRETECFLEHIGVRLDRKQIVELYMAMGGVAQYLKQAEPGQSAAQIVNDVCFSPHGYLHKEFYKLYRSLFEHEMTHIAVVKTLAKCREGMSRDDLLRKTALSSGGQAASIFRELEESGFIGFVPPYQRKKRGGWYRLTDEYTLFFLTWIENAPKVRLSPIEPDYWLKKQATSAWKTWAGYAFESVCLKHVAQIKDALGIRAITTEESQWRLPRVAGGPGGAQIDLIIDRSDGCINLCELKYYAQLFSLSAKDVAALAAKRNSFCAATKTRKTPFVTLISSYGAVEDNTYREIISNQLTIADLFR